MAVAGNPELEVTPCARPGLLPRFSFAAAMSLASLPVQAAPLTPLSAAAKPDAQGSSSIQVRWGGWGGGWHGGGIGFGIGALAAGALIGAAVSKPLLLTALFPDYAGYRPIMAATHNGYPYGYSTGHLTPPTAMATTGRTPAITTPAIRPNWRHQLMHVPGAPLSPPPSLVSGMSQSVSWL